MRSLLKAMVLVPLFAVLSAWADDAVEGHYGLLNMRSAETLGTGHYAYNIWFVGNDYSVPSNPAESLKYNDLTLSFHQGVGRSSEIAFAFPMRLSMGDVRSEYRFFHASWKKRIFGSRLDGEMASVTFQGTMVPTDASVGIGSGETNYGIELGYTSLFNSFTGHLNFGVERRDAIDIVDANNATFDVSNTAYWKLGMDYPFGKRSAFLLELDVNQDLSQAGSQLLLTPGYKYTSEEKDLNYQLGVAYNLSDDPNQPEARLFLGMSYSVDSPRSRVTQLQKQVADLEARLATLEVKTVVQDISVNRLEQRDTAIIEQELPNVRKQMAALSASLIEHRKHPINLAPQKVVEKRKRNSNIQVEVINSTEDENLTDMIKGRFISRGYDIVKHFQLSGETEERTHIYYAEGYALAAINLGHALPKNQVVLSAVDLPEGVEIRVVLGRDLLDVVRAESASQMQKSSAHPVKQMMPQHEGGAEDKHADKAEGEEKDKEEAKPQAKDKKKDNKKDNSDFFEDF